MSAPTKAGLSPKTVAILKTLLFAALAVVLVIMALSSVRNSRVLSEDNTPPDVVYLQYDITPVVPAPDMKLPPSADERLL